LARTGPTASGTESVILLALVISSFRVLDINGFDTVWGLGNYRTFFTDRVIGKAFVNTLIISSGSTVLATFLGVSLAWINARTNCPGATTDGSA
jgi:iron(III) transport system permease protein